MPLLSEKLDAEQLYKLLRIEDRNGDTHLHKEGNLQAVLALPQEKLSSEKLYELLRIEDRWGYTPLHYEKPLQAVLALSQEKISQEKLCELLQMQASNGLTPLQTCLYFPELVSILSEKLGSEFDGLLGGENAINENTPNNRSLIVHALKNRKQFSLNPYERFFLNKYGIRFLEEDISIVEDSCRRAGERLLLQSGEIAPEEFQQLLKEEFVKVLLKSSGADESIHKHFAIFSDQMKRVYEEIKALYKEERQSVHFNAFTEEAREKFPGFAKYLDRSKRYEINQKYLESLLNLLYKKFFSEGIVLEEHDLIQAMEFYSGEALTDLLPPFQELAQQAEQSVSFSKDASFCEFLASTVPSEGIFEYNQGEDGLGTVLGDGVCLGMCIERVSMFLENPDRPLTDREDKGISSKARRFQAFHGSRRMPRVGPQEAVPKSLQNQLGIKRDYTAQNLPHFPNLLLFQQLIFGTLAHDIFKKDPACQVTIRTAIGRHAIYMRFDQERNRYIFFDPNFGTFENRFDTFEEGILWLAQTLFECLKSYEATVESISHYSKIKSEDTP